MQVATRALFPHTLEHALDDVPGLIHQQRRFGQRAIDAINLFS
jgi:hypothetical protein